MQLVQNDRAPRTPHDRHAQHAPPHNTDTHNSNHKQTIQTVNSTEYGVVICSHCYTAGSRLPKNHTPTLLPYTADNPRISSSSQIMLPGWAGTSCVHASPSAPCTPLGLHPTPSRLELQPKPLAARHIGCVQRSTEEPTPQKGTR